jgi:hypothetical protein
MHSYWFARADWCLSAACAAVTFNAKNAEADDVNRYAATLKTNLLHSSASAFRQSSSLY